MQITRQMTTYEVSNLSKFGFMGGRGASMAMQQGHQHNGAGAGVSNDEDDPTGAHAGHSHGHGHGHGHRHNHSSGTKGAFGFILRLLGLDRFTRGKAASALAQARQTPNPFDLGLRGNCMDFWTQGQEVGVKYEALYDVPPEGFRAAKANKSLRDDDDTSSITGGGKRRGSTASRFMPNFLTNMRRPSNTYQAIAMTEEV